MGEAGVGVGFVRISYFCTFVLMRSYILWSSLVKLPELPMLLLDFELDFLVDPSLSSVLPFFVLEGMRDILLVIVFFLFIPE